MILGVPVPKRFNHELLRQVRLELDLSQEELAETVGIDVRTYRRYESGAVNVGGFTVRRASQRKLLQSLCDHLGLAENDLVLEEPDASPSRVRAFVPRRVHSLPRARQFVGRADELADIGRWLESPGATRVIAIVAMGGAGKSTLLGRALSRLGDDPLPYGVLLWSFYENPRTEDFLNEVVSYFGGQEACPPGERDRRLVEVLSAGAPHLLVLDGLELVQADDQPGLARGELVDPSLRRLLVAIAEGRGQSRAIITTRFSPTDLDGYTGGGYRQIDLGPLAEREAIELLSAFDVTGDLAKIVHHYGAHPLSVAMAASYARGFLGGDGDNLTGVDLDDAGKDDALARRLGRLLETYAESMGEVERDVVARLSLFAAGATAELLTTAGVESVHVQTALGRLCKLGVIERAASERYTAHPYVRDYFRRYLSPELATVGDAPSLSDQPSIRVPDQPLDELVAVFERTIAAGELEAAYDLYSRRLGGFHHLGLRRGDMVRGERLVRAFASGGSVRDLPRSLGSERCRALAYDWGLYLGAQGELERALACHEAAIDYVDQRTDALVVGLRAIAYITRLEGDLDRSLAALESSVDLAEEHELRGNLCRSLALWGRVLHDLGRVDDARRAFSKLAELGDEPVARRGVWIAEHRLDLGDVDGAISLTESNLAECERREWPGHVAHCHLVLATALAQTDPHRARRHLAAVDRWTSLTGEVELVLGGLEVSARLRRDEAAVRAGFELARRMGFRPAAGRLACALLEAAIRGQRQRRVEQAMDTARRAVANTGKNALVQRRFALAASRVDGPPRSP